MLQHAIQKIMDSIFHILETFTCHTKPPPAMMGNIGTTYSRHLQTMILHSLAMMLTQPLKDQLGHFSQKHPTSIISSSQEAQMIFKKTFCTFNHRILP
jgi:hypothetical protein